MAALSYDMLQVGDLVSKGDIMLVSVDGVNAAFKDRTIEIVEAIPGFGFKHTEVKGQKPTSVVFECESDDDNTIIPLVKGTLKKSELGNIMMFRVVPYGQIMWFPKR